MVVQGQITKREPIDVCGTMVDTYRVESTEQIVNVEQGYSSKTHDGDPNVYNVATQYGGLLVQQHTATTTTFASSGTTLIIVNTSTVTSTKPVSQK